MIRLPLIYTHIQHTILPSKSFDSELKYLRPFSFKRTLLKPCRKILRLLYKLRLRKPLSIKFRRRRKSTAAQSSTVTPSFRSRFDEEREIERSTEPMSFPEQKAPYPSPRTPAYVRMRSDDDVEDACRSFEKFLMDMILEEGKMRDLGDVEEVIYWWKELRSPVFVDLVCRFCRELCTDLLPS